MRVKADTEGGKLAGPIAGIIRSGDVAELDCIGSISVYQAVKGMYIAKTFLAADDTDLSISIDQIEKTIGGKAVTVYRFTVRGVKP